jgi:hypothetical protein
LRAQHVNRRKTPSKKANRREQSQAPRAKPSAAKKAKRSANLAHRGPPLYLFFGRFKTMTAAAHPTFEPGQVYRTRDLAPWGANPPRLAQRLVREGRLVPLAQGLFAAPKHGRFGAVPPTDEAVMKAFLDGTPFVFTGPERWNTLGLGTTAVFAMPLVYNTKRSGRFTLGGRTFLLRRVAFPQAETPPAEWYVVDLFEHAEQAAASREQLTKALVAALRASRFDPERLAKQAARYGSQRTRDLVAGALARSGRATA